MNPPRPQADPPDPPALDYQERSAVEEAEDEQVHREQRRVALAWFAVVVGVPYLIFIAAMLMALVWYLRK